LDIGLAIEMDQEVDRLSPCLSRINERLKGCFADKVYAGVADVTIGLILMGEGSEVLHPPRPVSYKKTDSFVNPFTRKRVVVKNALSFDVRPDYAKLRKLGVKAGEKYISESIVEAVDQLLAHKRKMPKFDIVKFKRDLAACLLP
jgi:hypothetical protein